jgi:hypothetical protein
MNKPKDRMMNDQELASDEDTPCKDHPDAPHGFDRNASLSEDRYVCECEYWEPPETKQMNQERIDDLLYEAGLTADGCWDQLDEYDRNAILRYGELMVKEVINVQESMLRNGYSVWHLSDQIKKHFNIAP